jgi:MOSC domain-containing protein YiiM
MTGTPPIPPLPPLPPAQGTVHAVCVARASRVRIGGREVLTAIGKRAVAGPVAVGPLGLAGDEQADLSVHGGLAKAVYAYPLEHYRFWQTVRAQARVALWDEPLAPGALGENLTLTGLTEDRLWIGDRLRVGDGGLELAVSEPRHPCFKFAAAMGFAQAVRLMWDSGFCGAYLTVLQPGPVQAGDAVRLAPGPRAVGVRELFRARAPARGAQPGAGPTQAG